MWLNLKRTSAVIYLVSLSLPLALMSCSGGNASGGTVLNELSGTIATVELTTQTLSENTTTAETTRTAEQAGDTSIAPTALIAPIVKSGYVTLQWEPSVGDTIRHRTEGDAVSYYQVFRNGVPFTDSLSPVVEDTQPPLGEVTYSVRAVKFETSPEFSMTHSGFIEVTVLVPSVNAEAIYQGGRKISASSLAQSLDRFQDCMAAYSVPRAIGPSDEMLCVNHLGFAWFVSETGNTANLLDHTYAVGGDVFVVVRNRDAEFGPIPDVPQWTTTRLATNETIQRELILTTPLIADEQLRVNGVTVSDVNAVYISGTLVQSYLPRSFGPSPGVLPVVSGYFVAQMNSVNGEMIKFKRFPLSVAPGALAAVNQGELVLFQTGRVTYLNASTLDVAGSVEVSGKPVFVNETYVYTSAKASTDESDLGSNYYRFER